jgi:hypothetical protein
VDGCHTTACCHLEVEGVGEVTPAALPGPAPVRAPAPALAPAPAPAPVLAPLNSNGGEPGIAIPCST